MDNNIYLCIKDTKDNFVPFFSLNGSFFSKKYGNDSETGGMGSICFDEIIQHINYKEVLENGKQNEVPPPITPLENSNEAIIDLERPNLDYIEKGGSNIEITTNNEDITFVSHMPPDYAGYLRNKLQKKNTK